MPVATASIEPEHFDLKSLPPKGEEEGGWANLRRMTYGEKLHRQDIAMDMSMRAEGRKARSEGAEMKITQAQTAVTEYELRLCVMDHNLTHPNGQKLDFRNPADVHMLDPRVGEEIGLLIDKMNTFEEELPNSDGRSGT